MLVLVFDLDREGEVIVWYVLEMLKMEGVLKRGIEVKWVVFYEIIKLVVIRVMEFFRDVSEILVNVYFVCWVLDYLIGFNLFFVFWCKLLGSKFVGCV